MKKNTSRILRGLIVTAGGVDTNLLLQKQPDLFQ